MSVIFELLGVLPSFFILKNNEGGNFNPQITGQYLSATMINPKRTGYMIL